MQTANISCWQFFFRNEAKPTKARRQSTTTVDNHQDFEKPWLTVKPYRQFIEQNLSTVLGWPINSSLENYQQLCFNRATRHSYRQSLLDLSIVQTVKTIFWEIYNSFNISKTFWSISKYYCVCVCNPLSSSLFTKLWHSNKLNIYYIVSMLIFMSSKVSTLFDPVSWLED